MSTKVHCYLRTLRNEWKLTQEELASLLPKGDRNRVSCVERGERQPNAAEILAYALIFGLSGQRIFPKLAEDTYDAVMQGGYALDQRLEKDGSTEASHKRLLLRELRARAISSLDEAFL